MSRSSLPSVLGSFQKLMGQLWLWKLSSWFFFFTLLPFFSLFLIILFLNFSNIFFKFLKFFNFVTIFSYSWDFFQISQTFLNHLFSNSQKMNLWFFLKFSKFFNSFSSNCNCFSNFWKFSYSWIFKFRKPVGFFSLNNRESLKKGLQKKCVVGGQASNRFAF